MKKLRVLFILVLLLFLGESNAQWVQTGSSGGWITDFKVNGNILYAASYGGVLVSSDLGVSWDHSNWDFLDGDVRSVVATSSRLYAGTYWSGVYMRDINGLIWQQTSLPDQAITCLTAIGDVVFAGTYSTGVWRTTDNGATWNQVNNGLTAFQVQCFAVKGTDIFAGVEGGGVFRSTDNGTTWVYASAGLPSDSPISLAVNGNDVYVGLWAFGIYTSPDDGQGWLMFGPSPINYVQAMVFNGSKMYIAGGDVFVTSNSGTDWTDLSDNGIPMATNIQSLAFIGGNLVAGDNAVNSSSGVYLSTNEGVNWTHNNYGVPNFCTEAIDARNGVIVTGTCGGAFMSTDDGGTWEAAVLHGDHEWADFSAISFRDNNYVFAGDENGYVYVSTDGGDEFTLKTQIEDGANVTSFAYISTYVFASTKPYAAGVAGGVYISYDNGETWTAVNNGLPTLADTNTVVSSLAVIGNNLFAGTGHGVYRSRDNGTSWSKVNNGLTAIWVYALAVKGTELFAGTFGQGVFRSNNYGDSWIHTSLDKDITSFTVADTSLFAGTWSEGIYRLINADSTWRYVGLPGVYVTSMAANNGYLYAATSNNNIWKALLSQLTDVSNNGNITLINFNLSQNFPNPFNPSTTIQYSIGSLQHVTLKVYDILGREVATLVNEEKPAGEYIVKFDAAGLSSGIYIYRIRTDSYSETRKMILMR
jgi:photosystem II stability/assembly factor-like uncharacterized protein